MSDTLDLPPYGPIPNEVRERVRQTVQKRIRRPKYRTPLIVAAAVAGLAAGAVVVTTRPSAPVEPAQPAPSNVTMDRCWAAIQRTGQTALYPERSKWRPAVLAPPAFTPQSVVGIASDKEPFFCQTTDTSVTVSAPATQPHYVPGSKTAAVLMLDGVLAGVIDPAWPAALISTKSGSLGSFTPSEGMFIFDLDVYRNPADGDITISKAGQADQIPAGRRPAGEPVPRPDDPAITLVDRPAPPQDRTSQVGKALGNCLATATGQLVFDQDSYGPAAVMAKDEAQIIMARNPVRASACAVSPGSGVRELRLFGLGPKLADIDKDKPVAFDTPGVNLNAGSRRSYGGLVPLQTTRMVLRFDNGAEVEAAVAQGTFVAIVPLGAVPDTLNLFQVTVVAKLFDANGSMFYSGPVTYWTPPR
jgi:hypothetical protein